MRVLSLLALLLSVAACDDGAADATSEDAGIPEGSYFEGEGYVLPGSHANVVRRIDFDTLVEPGVALGFDLDGRTSEYGDEVTCGHADLSDPEGNEGIDNQLAAIWADLVEPLVGEAANGLLQGAVNEGVVLIMIELVGVDDLRNDGDVTVNVFRGLLDPDVGTQGLISPSQTFYFDYDAPISTVEGVKIVDGTLVAGPIEVKVPLQIFDLDIIAHLHGGQVRLDIADDGTFSGHIGGALTLDEFMAPLLETGAASEARLIAPIFQRNADLAPVDGVCTQFSVALKIEGTTAYVVRDHALEQ